MFSPSAENLPIPGRPPAAPRSRWLKSPVRAIRADHSAAIRARSLSQSSSARFRARRSALSRSNRSLASRSAVDTEPDGGVAVVGAAVALGLGPAVVVALVVVGLVVAGRRGLVVGVAPLPGALATWRSASRAGAAAAAPAGCWPGLAPAGISAQASSSGKAMRKAVRRFVSQGLPGRACRGRVLARLLGSWSCKLTASRGGGPDRHRSARKNKRKAGSRGLSAVGPWGELGGWPTTRLPFQTRQLLSSRPGPGAADRPGPGRPPPGSVSHPAPPRRGGGGGAGPVAPTPRRR